MKRGSSEWTVKMLTDVKKRIDTDAEYQRGIVWSDNQQRLLVDSLLRGYDLPKIYLRKLPDGSALLYEVVDGVQRLTAIWRFMNNELRLRRDSTIDGLGSLGGKRWSELPVSAQDKLQFSKITVSELEDATEDEVAELFLRLQKGETLRAAERRNAIRGPVRDFVANSLVKLEIFPNLGIPNRRMTWRELSAIALLLIIEDGPTTLKSPDLEDLYYKDDFDPDGMSARGTITALNRLNEVASLKTGMIATRWGFVDLLLTLRQLDHDSVSWSASAVKSFFEAFESERRDAATKLDELQAEVQELDPNDPDPHLQLPDVRQDMFLYVRAFTREGATEPNVRTRSDIMHRRLTAFLADAASTS